MKKYFALLLILTATQPVHATPHTAVLEIPGMSCAACPITLKIALNRVAGVTATAFNIDKRQAIVTFDAAKTDPETLLRATSDAGYPATLKEHTP